MADQNAFTVSVLHSDKIRVPNRIRLGFGTTFIDDGSDLSYTMAVEPNEIVSDKPKIITPGIEGAACSFYIKGAPTAGTNCTFASEPFALKVDSGLTQLDTLKVDNLVVTGFANFPADGGNIGGYGISLVKNIPITNPTTTWIMKRGEIGVLTLTQNVHLDVAEQTDGGVYTLVVKQDGVGSRDIVWSSKFKFPGGEPPALASGPNNISTVQIVCLDSNTLLTTSFVDYQ